MLMLKRKIMSDFGMTNSVKCELAFRMVKKSMMQMKSTMSSVRQIFKFLLVTLI